jgi:hypothetical protein
LQVEFNPYFLPFPGADPVTGRRMIMMKVKLARRWGPHRAGKTVEVSDSQGAWLVQHSYGESSGDVVAPVQPAAAEGTYGADPLAGGDASRLRPRMGLPARDARVNYAAPAAGSSPTYRAGFDGDAVARQGAAGREELAAAAEEKPADEKKPARRRSSRSSS